MQQWLLIDLSLHLFKCTIHFPLGLHQLVYYSRLNTHLMRTATPARRIVIIVIVLINHVATCVPP